MKQSRWLALMTLMLVCLTAMADDSAKVRFTATNGDGVELKYVVLSEQDRTAAVEGGQIVPLLTIPSVVSYNGQQYTVTEIAANAFSGGNLKLNQVVLPPTIIKIGVQAFAMCLRLNKINFPEGLQEIGEMAFASTKLQSLALPQSLLSVGPKAFVPKWDRATPGNYAVESLPSLVNENNCESMGISRNSVAAYHAAHTNQSALAQQQSAIELPRQEPVRQNAGEQANVATVSDVDIDLPTVSTTNDDTFAVIIANENYQEEVKVEFALNDGEMFRQYCQKVLGLPETNIHIRRDATLNNIIAEMAWMQKVAEAYQGKARFIVYYAGHGIPDEKSGTAYLLPTDGKGSIIETAYSLQQFYKQLGEMPSAGITVFMDACFSGSLRGNGMLASARGVAIKAKQNTPQGPMVVFSAAQGDETAYPFKEKNHGLFTYFLLKKLKDTGGQVSLGELGDYITNQVSRKSIVTNGKSQTPCISPSTAISGDWKKLHLARP